MSEKLPLTPSLTWARYRGDARLGLNSSELIIRVALFEAFLKEIHRQTLLANPQLLSVCKPNRAIQLRELFRSPFERFKFDEIERQVREMDRLKTKDKARFFQRRLKLPWGIPAEGESDVVKRIDDLIQMRHQLIHGDHDNYVSDKMVKDARFLFWQVPGTCISTAAKLYPSHFV